MFRAVSRLGVAAILSTSALVAIEWSPTISQASPIVTGHPGMGYLWNFDTTNNTDRECQGFEVQIDGATAADVLGTYWGTYAQPTVTDTTFNGVAGVDVVWSATYASNTWSVSTPAGGLEHFGVSLGTAPGNQRYTWLCDDPSNPGHLSQYGGTTEGNGYPMPTDPNLVLSAGTSVPAVAAGATLAAKPVVTAVTRQLVNNAPAAPGDQTGDAFFACHYELTTNQTVALADLLTDSNLVKATLSGHQILDQCDLINGGGTYNMPKAEINGDNGNKAVTDAVYLYQYTGTYDDAHTPNCSESPSAQDYCANDLGSSIAVDMIAAANANGGNRRGLGVQTVGQGEVDIVNPVDSNPDASANMTDVASPAVHSLAAGTSTKACTAAKVCGEVLNTNSVVTLTATPAPGYVFAGWVSKLNGANATSCTKTATTCTVSLSKSVNIVASFTTAPVPSVKSLSTTSATRGKTVTITVTGTNFVKGSVVSFAGTGLVVTTTYKSATSLSAKVVIAKSAAKGLRVVTVTNPSGTRVTSTKGLTLK